MKNTWNDFVKPIVVLGVICLVTSLLLAVTNNVTAPIIAENAVKTANATRQALLPSADTFTEVAPETPTEGVTAIYKADNDSGYVITAQAKGYGGEVPVMVAFNAEGTIEAVQFLDNDETPGLGQKVKSEAFQSQFSGMPAEEFGLSDIDAITGATISSGAAASAINAAIAAYNQEAGVAGEDLSALSPEELRAALLPDAGAITPVDVSADGVTEAYKGEAYGVVIYAQAEGFYKKPVTAAVGFGDGGGWMRRRRRDHGRIHRRLQ